MLATKKQQYYISHILKVNKGFIKEVDNLFPEEIEEDETGHKSDMTYLNLEKKISKIGSIEISDVIGMLKDDLILEGFNQLDYLIKNY